jgi:serine protease
VVATDFRGEVCTSVFDADAGIALDKTFVKVVSLVRQRVGLLEQDGNGQWFLKTPTAEVRSAINAEAAWNIGTNASNVVVAVIDTGVRPEHPDLRANLVAGYDVIGIGSTGSVANAVANDGDLADADPSDPGDWINQADIDLGRLGGDCTSDDIGSSSWHGTRVAGLIGAVGNNGLGVAGVFWSGKMSTVRALGKCGGYDSDIWRGIRWAVGADVPGLPSNANPARVVNMSLGGSGRCTGDDGIAYTDAIREANLRGAVVVVAAGNSNGGPVDNPANCVGAIAVAGLRHAGTKVGLSSMGVEVALSAPAGNCVNATGACLYTMLSTTNNGSEGPGLDTYTDTAASVGTSFAAPLVAGTAALMLSRNPSLSADDVRRILRETARPFPSQGAEAAVGSCSEPVTVDTGECYCTQSTCGAGMLDTSAAVLAAATKGGPPVVSVSGAPTSVTVGNTRQPDQQRQPGQRPGERGELRLAHRQRRGPGQHSAAAAAQANAQPDGQRSGKVSVQLTRHRQRRRGVAQCRRAAGGVRGDGPPATARQ